MATTQHRQITPTSPSPSPSPAPHDPSRPDPPEQSAPGYHHQNDIAPTNQHQPDSPDEKLRATLEQRVREIVDCLYQLAVCAADVQEGSEHLLGHKINETVRALAELDATKGNIRAMIPDDVIEMLDAGRNPDIHTRSFISRLASENQYSYGQHLAVKEYNAQLSAALDQAFPALKGDATQPHK